VRWRARRSGRILPGGRRQSPSGQRVRRTEFRWQAHACATAKRGQSLVRCPRRGSWNALGDLRLCPPAIASATADAPAKRRVPGTQAQHRAACVNQTEHQPDCQGSSCGWPHARPASAEFRAMLKICVALRDNTKALLKANESNWGMTHV
jgi:hypothetical protein